MKLDILIKNIDFTLTMDNNNTVIKNGNIGIRDGKIEFVNIPDSQLADVEADRVIDGRHRLAMPGLVNAHTHCAMTLLRNYADDLPLEDWLFNKIIPVETTLSPEDIYWGTKLGIIEMIKSGTTSFADMYIHMDEVARAVMESGIRANLSRSPFFFHGGSTNELIDECQDCFDYHRKWDGAGEGRIKVYIEVHSTYLFDEGTLRASAELAKSCGTGIHIHVLETLNEVEESKRKYGAGSVEVCEKFGILDVPVIAAHCVYVTDSDMDIFKAKGVSVAHNPTSNLKLGSGIARIPQMLEKGLNVAIGTDGTASNNNLNMFEEMHIAALLHKGTNRNPALVSAVDALRMATVNGAEAIGFKDEVGRIEKGMKADIILLDIDKPHLFPINNPVSATVYSAQGSDVDTVIIDGKIVLENGNLTTIDEELVKHKVGKISERISGAKI